MACYAAVLSLYHTLNNIKIHPRPPISLDQNQVESLNQNLTFFQHFLESNPTYEDDDLESRIANAAYAAEDVIETHIVDQIHAGSTSHDHGENVGCVDFCNAVWRVMNLINKNVKKIIGAHSGENSSSVDLYADLERVIQDMDLIKTELMEIIQHKIVTSQHVNSSSGGPAAAPTGQGSITPVFDDDMITQALDKLTRQQSSLQIIPIVGMGGIGKTTFATSLYTNPLVVEHFDIRAWVTILQEYSVPEILRQVLGQGNKDMEMSENELKEKVHKKFLGRRYCIVMDDVWSVEALDKVMRFFPENSNGSRIMITTRLSSLAFELSGNCHVFQMQFLDEDKSWELLSEIVFGKQDCPVELENIAKQDCPVELENIGKVIAGKCGGLPLSIAVIGGLLRKFNKTLAYWIYTLENLNSLINLDNDEYALRILRTSYKELPMHLKPCFLYMGIFPEDEEINTSMLIRLWVAEGILRPVDDKSLEEVGKEYLKQLIDRNLILIAKLRWDGEVKLCKIHDLLRDVCLREAQKQKFLCILRQQKDHTPQGINMERRICINLENTDEKYSLQLLHALETAALTRSLLYTLHSHMQIIFASPPLHSRLLRVYSLVGKSDAILRDVDPTIFEQANLRYLSLDFKFGDIVETQRFASLCSLLWNLQSLEIGFWMIPNEIPSKIWEMPLLRHVMLKDAVLLDPPNEEHNYVLENLQTLKNITNMKFSEEVVKRIPNVKKLKLAYKSDALDFCLNNLGRLQKLESLSLGFPSCGYNKTTKIRRNLASFPHSLKKLCLSGTKISWEELTTTIGPLPLLQVLILDEDACVGPSWKTIEGKFCSLRVLQIEDCYDLKYWETDSSHFPCLEHLLLGYIRLEKIPSSIGDIPTLKSIWLEYCYRSVADSARRIKEEQEEYGNQDLLVVINGQMVGMRNNEEPMEEDSVDSDEEEATEED